MNNNFPKKGDKLTVKNPLPKFFYPHFTNMVEDAKKVLIPGETYTVKKCKVYSSWCAVWLEEIEDYSEERENRFFSLNYFVTQKQ